MKYLKRIFKNNLVKLKEINYVSWGYIVHHILNGALFIIFPKIFPPSALGIYGIYSFWYFLLFSLLTFGVENAILFDSKFKNIVLIIRFLLLILSVEILVSCCLLLFFYQKGLVDFLYFFLPIHVGIHIVYDIFFHINVKNNNAKINIFMQLLSVILHFLMTFILMLFFGRAICFIVMGGIASYMVCIACYVKLIKNRTFKKMMIFRCDFFGSIFQNFKIKKEYFHYMIYHVIYNASDILILYSPLIYIKEHFGLSYAGYYFLVVKILNLPIVCVSTPIMKFLLKTQFFSQKIYKKIIIKIAIIMTIISCLIYGFLMMLDALNIFSALLGDQWKGIGKLFYILSMKCAFEFIVFPFLSWFFNKEKIKQIALFKLCCFIMQTLFLYALNDINIEKTMYVLLKISFFYSVFIFLYMYFQTFQKEQKDLT